MLSQLLIITKSLFTFRTDKRSDIHVLRPDVRSDGSTICKALVAKGTLNIIMLDSLQDMLHLILLIVPACINTKSCQYLYLKIMYLLAKFNLFWVKCWLELVLDLSCIQAVHLPIPCLAHTPSPSCTHPLILKKFRSCFPSQ